MHYGVNGTLVEPPPLTVRFRGVCGTHADQLKMDQRLRWKCLRHLVVSVFLRLGDRFEQLLSAARLALRVPVVRLMCWHDRTHCRKDQQTLFALTDCVDTVLEYRKESHVGEMMGEMIDRRLPSRPNRLRSDHVHEVRLEPNRKLWLCAHSDPFSSPHQLAFSPAKINQQQTNK